MILSDKDSESLQFDCSRGCTVGRDSSSGELECKYRLGCCKLETYDWLRGIQQSEYSDLFEVRFKNTRKGIYRNESGQSIRMGDLVIVEAQSGHDLGIVTLEGPVVVKQIKCRGLDPDSSEFRRIYRKAKPFDIDKWQEAIAREQETMIRARQIAKELNLDMKIGDVEFQGDGTKAIFYYIADGRVDFRQLIKVYAEEFRIRIEMKQIGARQEAGLIGGLGVCGRELCCANYITTFKSITTSAARCQDLSMNPQKLAGQCGKLKCCLNYEVAAYLDAQSHIPKVSGPIEFEDGLAYLMKTDILQQTLYFSYDKTSLADLYPVPASKVRMYLEDNKNGIKPPSLKGLDSPAAPEFVDAVGDGSISRFDRPKNRKKNGQRQRGQDARQGQNRPQDAQRGQDRPQPSQAQPQRPRGQNARQGQRHPAPFQQGQRQRGQDARQSQDRPQDAQQPQTGPASFQQPKAE